MAPVGTGLFLAGSAETNSQMSEINPNSGPNDHLPASLGFCAALSRNAGK